MIRNSQIGMENSRAKMKIAVLSGIHHLGSFSSLYIGAAGTDRRSGLFPFLVLFLKKYTAVKSECINRLGSFCTFWVVSVFR